MQSAMERRGMGISALVSLIMAVTAFLFAFGTDSQTVLLDGFYSLLTCLCGLASLRISTLLRRPDDERYPFGYAGFEPLLNLVRGTLVGGVTFYGACSALVALTSAGSEVDSGFAALYGIITATSCFAVAVAQKGAARRTGAPLLEVDARSWTVDGLISLGVCFSFLSAWTLEGRVSPEVLNLVDPLTMLVLCLVTAPVPARIILSAVRELLAAAPCPRRQGIVTSALARELRDLPVLEVKPRLTQVGREFYLNLYVILERDAPLSELDELRSRLVSVSRDLEPHAIVDILFTMERRWADPEPVVQS